MPADFITQTRNPKLLTLDLRPMNSEQCALYTAGGSVFEIHEKPDVLAAFLGRCNGHLSREELLDGTPSPEDYAALLDLLETEGCLAFEPEKTTQRMQVKLWITGDPSLGSSLARMLREDSAEVWFPIDQLERSYAGNKVQPELLLVLLPFMDAEVFSKINTFCLERKQSWLPFHFEGQKSVLGPLIIPGETSDYEDVIGRRTCSGNQVEAAQLRRPLRMHEGAPCQPTMPSPLHQSMALARYAKEVMRWLDEKDSELLSTELLLDHRSGQEQFHTVLPLPTRVPKIWRAKTRSQREMLVDSRMGIILSQKRVPHHESIPSSLITIRTHCTDLSQIYSWGNDLFVGGSSFHDPIPAEGASLGEALERYCGNCLPGVQTIKASYNQLKRKGQDALDPSRLVLHSEKMLATPGCPFVPFSKDLEVRWVPGHSITHEKPCLLPISLVYANWCSGDLADEPLTNYLYTPGMAAGANLEQALVGALRELVERDITMIWWFNAQPLPAVEPTAELRELWSQVPDSEHQRVIYLHLDNPFNIPVMVAVVENTRHQFLNIGFGCRPDPVEAAKKALTEALTLQEGSRDLLEQDSMLRKSAEEWGLLTVPYKPWRADRTYMDAFRPDFRDINDLMLQQQFFLDPRAVERVRPFLDTPVTRSFNDLPSLPDNSLASYVDRIQQLGFEILYADITSPDVALTGFKVVRALIPGLVPNMPTAFPAVGGTRVFQVPLELGWRTTPLTEVQLNMFPMPHA